jgi:D-sedoheptulose 7-phosphate isomerase
MDYMERREVAGKAILQHLEVTRNLEQLLPKLLQASEILIEAFHNKRKILLCGNGGSAADAQHLAGELVGRFLCKRPPLPALALSVNTSVLTAVGNDYGFEEVFARQVAALGQPGDVLVAISTSGDSSNVLRAAEAAKAKGMKVIGLTGADGGKLKDLCDFCLCVPSTSTPRIQEMHILIGHIICQLVEADLCCLK